MYPMLYICILHNLTPAPCRIVSTGISVHVSQLQARIRSKKFWIPWVAKMGTISIFGDRKGEKDT